MMPRWSLLLAVVLLAVSTAVAGERIRLGTEGAYPPFNFVDDAGNLRGFDIDVARVLCERMDAECEFVLQSWRGIIPALLEHEFDAIVASMSITQERARRVAFTDPYYSNTLQFVGREGASFDVSAEGLEDRALGAQLGTISQFWLERHVGKTATIKLYDLQEHAYLDLIAGRLDAVLADRLVTWAWLRTEAGRGFEFKGEPVLENDRIAIAVRKEDEALRRRFNAALEAIRADGTYRAINERYFPFSIDYRSALSPEGEKE